MHDPSFSESCPFLCCFMGTLSPSRRHKHYTRLSFICQPASLSNHTIAISTVLMRQPDHISDYAFFVSTPLWQSTLRGSALAQNATNPSLPNLKLTTHKINAGRVERRAQKFPDAASFKINLSSVRSETARRRGSLSFFGRFSSLICSVPI